MYLLTILQCLLLSFIFVGSIYIWKNNNVRDHPITVKKRFLSVGIASFIISPAILYICINKKYLKNFSLWQLLGIRISGILEATTLPLLLTMLLFLGPILTNLMGIFTSVDTNTGGSDDASSRPNQLNNKRILWIRTMIVAPICEEFTFRACMVPLLVQDFTYLTTIFVCPLFFGSAHFNHIIENIRTGYSLKQSILNASFRFAYTSIFGAYSTFLFLRTGHLISPFIVHSFCNLMGFPEVSEMFNYFGWKRYLLIGSFICGLVTWISLLLPLTEPSIYNNNIYWVQNYSTTK